MNPTIIKHSARPTQRFFGRAMFSLRASCALMSVLASLMLLAFAMPAQAQITWTERSGSVAEGTVFPFAVGETLPGTFELPNPSNDSALQSFLVNGCQFDDDEDIHVRGFSQVGTACDYDSSFNVVGATFGIGSWKFKEYFDPTNATLKTNTDTTVGAAWASDLKAIEFKFSASLSGTVLTRNFTFSFFTLPTLAAQSNLDLPGGVISYELTPATNGYRGVDGTDALTYSIALSGAGNALPGIGIDVKQDGTPVLTATATSAAYAATGYTLTVEDGDGNTATTDFTIAVQASTALAFGNQPPITFTAGNVSVFTLAAASGTNPAYTLSRQAGNFPSSLNFDSDTLELTSTADIADGDKGNYILQATVGLNTVATTFNIQVEDAPSFATQPDLNFNIGETKTVTLGAATGGAGGVIYVFSRVGGSAVPSQLAFDPATRILTATNIQSDANGDYLLTATDTNGIITTTTFAINLYTALTLEAEQVDMTFTRSNAGAYTLPEATGGSSTWTYSLSPTLPAADFAVDILTRQLRFLGTASPSDQAEVIWKVTDASGEAATTFTITFVDAPAFAANDITALTAGYTYRVGTLVELPLPAVSGGSPALTYKLTAGASSAYTAAAFSANGLVFDPATRILSGTPTAAQTHPLAYHARDLHGVETAQNTGITIIAALAISQEDLAYQISTTGISETLATAVNNIGTVTYSLVDEGATTLALPGTLAFSAAGPSISGNAPATVTTLSFVLTAHDTHDDSTASTTFNIVISDKPVFPSAGAVATYTVGYANYYREGILSDDGDALTLPAAAATGLTTYSNEGALPGGMTAADLTADQVAISGTPNAAGDFAYSRIVTSGMEAATFSLMVHVAAAPSLAQQVDLRIEQGAAATFTLQVGAGGAVELQYALTRDVGTFPSALIFNPSTRILRSTTGILKADSGAYTLTATDRIGAFATTNFTLTVSPPLSYPRLANFTFTGGNNGEYLIPEAEGGGGMFTYSITSLPGSVTLDSASRLLAYTDTGTTPSDQVGVVITAHDTATGGAMIASNGFTIVFVDPPSFGDDAIETLDATLSFRAGVPIAQNTVLPQADGGTQAVTYKITAGASSAYGDTAFAANGIGFDPATRTVSGMPTSGMVHVINYHVRDYHGVTVSRTTSFVVVNPLTIANQPDLPFDTNLEGIDESLPIASNNIGVVQYDLRDLNGGNFNSLSGLTFDSPPPSLSGTAASTMTMMMYVLTATDGFDNAKASTTFAINIFAPPMFSPPGLDATFTVGATSFTIDGDLYDAITLPAAMGGFGNVDHATGIDTLPLNLGESERADDSVIIRGIPQTAGDFTFTRIATDSGNSVYGDRSGTYTLAVHIEPAPTFTDAAVSELKFTVGESFTVGMGGADKIIGEVGGGFSMITYSLTPVFPPTVRGLRFDGSGGLVDDLLSGEEDNAARIMVDSAITIETDRAQYTLTAYDANGATVEHTFYLEVLEGFDFPVAQNYSLTLADSLQLPQANGGGAQYTYELWADKDGDGLVGADEQGPFSGMSFNANTRTIEGDMRIEKASDLRHKLYYRATDTVRGAVATRIINLEIIPLRFPDGRIELQFIAGQPKSFDLSKGVLTAVNNGATVFYDDALSPEVLRDPEADPVTECSDPRSDDAPANCKDPGLFYYGGPAPYDRANAGNITLPILESDATYAFDYDPKNLTYTLTAKFAIGGSEATIRKDFHLDVIQAHQLIPVNATILSKVAAVSVAGTLGAITDRIANAAKTAPYNNEPYFQIGGNQSSMESAFAANAKALADGTLDRKAMLNGTKFVMPFGNAGQNIRAHGAFWGSAHYRKLDLDGNNRAAPRENIDWRGDVLGVQLGFDLRIYEDYLIGVALSQTDGKLQYQTAADDEKSDYDIAINAVYPYFSRRRDQLTWWASIGGGDGDLVITQPGVEGETRFETELGMVGYGVGVSNDVTDQVQLRAEFRGADVDIKANDEGTILQQDITTRTSRAMIKWHDMLLTERRSAFLELGLRNDTGDGEIGTAMESAVGWSYRGYDSTIEFGANFLLGREDYDEWGVFGQFRIVGAEGWRGLSLSVRPSYGDVGEEFGKLWNADLQDDLDDGGEAPIGYQWRTESRLAYGMQGAGGKVVPFGEMVIAEDDIYRLGVDWTPPNAWRNLDLNLTGERHHNKDRLNENRVLLQGEVKF